MATDIARALAENYRPEWTLRVVQPDPAPVSDRSLFVDMNDYPGRPDGAAMDADGCYWIAGNDAGCLLRFTPAGKLDRRIDLPVVEVGG